MTDTLNKKDESCGHSERGKKARHKRIHIVWCHICEIQEQAELTDGDTR